MIKMVVSSFYNTLINSEEAISTKTMIEIERIRKKGILFVVTTNRLYKEVLEYNKDFPFIDYIVSLNGSCLYNVEKNTVIFKKKLTHTKIKKISEIVKNQGIMYYTTNERYDDITNTENQDIYKIEIDLSTITEKEQNEIKKMKVNTSILKKEEKDYLEITNYHANMFTGVDQIALKNNISLDEIITISGNESEINIVQNIKKSYIVKNASPSLKTITKKQTSSCNENGVEEIIKRIK